jgi:hypothetical protein
VGILHRRTSSRPPCAMGRVLYRFPWPPPVSGHYAPQACGVSGSASGNRSVYEYIQEFNNLAQYKSHHVDTNAKKAELFRKGLTIQLQDCLILSQNLSYNELASAAIDQEGNMKACEAAEEKKRKRAVSGPTGGGSSSAPLKYRMIYTPPAGQPHRPPPQF